MKRLKKLYRRVISLCLCAALILGSFPSAALAAEDVEVTVTRMEELVAPTEFPAKGIMHIQVAKDVSMDADGNKNYSYEDAYLTVLVDKNKIVYADLDVLCRHLGYTYEEFGDTVLVHAKSNHMIFSVGDTEVAYVNYFLTASANIKRAPFRYDEKFYVPVDGFVQITGASGFYYGENELGKKDLFLMPAQRTVMDDMADFCENAYNKYVFSFIKDLKYSEEKTAEQAGMASLIQYLDGLIRLEGQSWGTFKVCILADVDDVVQDFDDDYVDNFMESVLKLNAEALDEMVMSTKKEVDIISLSMDVIAKWAGHEAGGYKSQAISNVASYERLFNETQKQDYMLSVQENENMIQRMSLCKKALKARSLINMTAGAVSAYSSMLSNLSEVHDWSLDGATELYDRRSGLSNPVFNENDTIRVKKNIDQYKGNINANAWDKFLDEYSWKLFIDTVTFFGIGSEVKLGSKIYGAIADELVGKQLAETENYLSACFGIQYEVEALDTAMACIDKYVKAVRYNASGKVITEEQIRKIFYHTMAACYVTREMGCDGCSLQLKKYPEIAATQELYNQKLAEMMGRALDGTVPMGHDYNDLANIQINELDHFPNVFFNLVQVQGEILSLEDGKPAQGAEVKIVDKEGEVLAEFIIGKDGKFDEAFEVAEADPFSDEPMMIELTFHMNYKRYEEMLETVEVLVFQKSQIDGLRVGEEIEEIKGYLTGAREVDGQVILDIKRVTLDEDTIYFDLQDWGVTRTYTVLPGQGIFSDKVEKLILDEGVTFETVYSIMAPEGSFIHGMVGIMDYYDASLIPKELIESELHEAADIQAFVDAYYEGNKMYPTFEIKKVNSVVRNMEPVMIITSD